MLLDAATCAPVDGAPDVEHYVAPHSVEQTAEIMRAATDHQQKVLFWGGGSHQGHGYAVDPDIVLSTHRLSRMVHWEPDDLTVVVEAGVRVADLEAMLAEKGQTAVLPESPGPATVGGTIAAGGVGMASASVRADPRPGARNDHCHRGWPGGHSGRASRQKRHRIRSSASGDRVLRLARRDRPGVFEAVAERRPVCRGGREGRRSGASDCVSSPGSHRDGVGVDGVLRGHN